jgi:deazaflavin-dependent oxidoreductase (nitroreductase family)
MYKKPGAAVRIANSILGFFTSLGVSPAKVHKIEVRGRKSGQLRTAVINVLNHDGDRYLVAPRGNTEWVRNVRAANGDATLLRKEREKVHLEEVAVDQRAAIIKAYVGENAAATKQYFGVEPGDTIEKYQQIASDHPVFKVISARR